MQLGMIGLGRMGANMARRLHRAGHSCVGYDRDPKATRALSADGVGTAASLKELVGALSTPRAICIMVPAAFVDASIDELAPLLAPGDVIIDGGNSHYPDDIARADRLRAKQIDYIDMGTSGGVWGLERGYCLMIGGEKPVVKRLEPIFTALAPDPHGYLHCGPAGAGHFVKMIHNGIEYGMMAAYAEGFNILHKAGHFQYDFDLAAIAELWRHGSVITSWLLDLTADALKDDPKLAEYKGHVADSGEGRWTIQAAIDVGVPAHVLTASLFERFASRGEDAFQNKVLSAMRAGFGGHSEKA